MTSPDLAKRIVELLMEPGAGNGLRRIAASRTAGDVRQCAYCCRDFNAQRDNQVVCSDNCGYERWKKKRRRERKDQ